MFRPLSAVTAIALLLAIPAHAEDAAPADAAKPAAEPAAAAAPADPAPAPAAVEVTPAADAVLAKVNGEAITYAALQSFLDGLDPQVKMIPLASIYENLLDVLINSRLLAQAGEKAGLDKTGEGKFRLDHAKLEITLVSAPDKVEQRIAMAREKVLRDIYVQTEIDKRLTAGLLRADFDSWMKDNPPVERHLRHILVEKEEDAKEIIGQLKGGADFAALAKEKSTDKSSDSGDLGWHAKDAMLVKPFLDAAWAQEKGTVSETPVKTQFGWHVIKVEDERVKPVSYEDKAPELLEQAQRRLAEEVVQDLRKAATVERFGLDGKPMADAPAEAAKP